jgi:hypothetical protein
MPKIIDGELADTTKEVVALFRGNAKSVRVAREKLIEFGVIDDNQKTRR